MEQNVAQNEKTLTSLLVSPLFSVMEAPGGKTTVGPADADKKAIRQAISQSAIEWGQVDDYMNCAGGNMSLNCDKPVKSVSVCSIYRHRNSD